MARILLGVSGGIAAYKALEFVRLATAAGHAVRVVQTRSSQRFIGTASFAALTGAPVLVSEFEHDPARGAFPGEQPPAHAPLSHLELPARAEVYLIAPASANTIAKLAAGMAEDMLGACALAASCPVLVGPAMNNHMYEHAATQANLETLRERGVEVIGPATGRLASIGEHGAGRLLEPNELLKAAAVADFRPAAPSATKIKKAASHDLVLELEPTVDVLGELTRSRRAGQTLVGFAAEHGADALRDARRKLIDKGLDAIVVNDISREDIGFDAEDNEVTILTAANGRSWRAGRGEHADGSEAHARLARTTQMTVSKAPKLLVAEAILDVVERLRGG